MWTSWVLPICNFGIFLNSFGGGGQTFCCQHVMQKKAHVCARWQMNEMCRKLLRTFCNSPSNDPPVMPCTHNRKAIPFFVPGALVVALNAWGDSWSPSLKEEHVMEPAGPTRADFQEGMRTATFQFQSPAVHCMAWTSSLNCLSSFTECLSPCHWKGKTLFSQKCFVASPSPISAPKQGSK